jgi:ubiquinone/menaquinone biosynthesis C-methylase UbiE
MRAIAASVLSIVSLSIESLFGTRRYATSMLLTHPWCSTNLRQTEAIKWRVLCFRQALMMQPLLPRLSLLPVMAREIFGSREFPREPEPDLVMDDPEQVRAYAEAGRADGTMAAAYLFHSAQISQVIQGCNDVIDLGCGPATQLAQIAQVNPGVSFLGVDLSERMLASAQEHIVRLGLDNVRFMQGDITRLGDIGDRSADAVISTLTLHHLPTYGHLERCFQQVSRILRPGGSLYMVDFCRLKSLRSVLYFAYMNAKHQPHIFSLDYERSLRAAFEHDEMIAAASSYLPSDVHLISTFQVPFLMIARTKPKPISNGLAAHLRHLRSSLSPRYRRDLDELRLFFRLGGLTNDPFAH